MNQPLKRALKRFAGVALCLLGLMVVLFMVVWSPPPFSYVHLAALAGAVASLAIGRPRALFWTAAIGVCLAATVSATFLTFIMLESGIDWAHPTAWMTIAEVLIVFGALFLSFGLGLHLWNAPVEGAPPAQESHV